MWYSGLPDGMWGENGQVNGNGQAMTSYDSYFNPLTNQWSNPTAWSITARFEHRFTPQFYVDLSVGRRRQVERPRRRIRRPQRRWGGAPGDQGRLYLVGATWLIGADIGWNPVTNLNFDLELMYQGANQDKPNGFVGTIYNVGGAGGPTSCRAPGKAIRAASPAVSASHATSDRSRSVGGQPRSESSGAFWLLRCASGRPETVG